MDAFMIGQFLSDEMRRQITILIVINAILFLSHVGRGWWSAIFRKDLSDVNRVVDTMISFGIGANILFLFRLPLIGVVQTGESYINLSIDNIVLNMTDMTQ